MRVVSVEPASWGKDLELITIEELIHGKPVTFTFVRKPCRRLFCEEPVIVHYTKSCEDVARREYHDDACKQVVFHNPELDRYPERRKGAAVAVAAGGVK